MNEQTMKKKLYNAYQLRWMLGHGKAIKDIFKRCLNDDDSKGFRNSQFIDTDKYGQFIDTDSMYSRWESNVRFEDGEIWNSFDNFCVMELTDIGYMFEVIRTTDWNEREALLEAYCEYIKYDDMKDAREATGLEKKTKYMLVVSGIDHGYSVPTPECQTTYYNKEEYAKRVFQEKIEEFFGKEVLEAIKADADDLEEYQRILRESSYEPCRNGFSDEVEELLNAQFSDYFCPDLIEVREVE